MDTSLEWNIVVVLRIFTSRKSPSSSAEFEPSKLGSRGEHVTPRPPRLTGLGVNKIYEGNIRIDI